MPSNVAHMLICHKAIQKLKEKGIDEYTEFATLLDDSSKKKNYRAYMNLGSLGPDLFYYSRLLEGVKSMLVDGYVQAKGVEPWSYHLHSYMPNKFPLKLTEIVFRDAIREKDAIRKKGEVKLVEDDYRKLAFIAGFLTHVAADQIIHPIVNEAAGPYYRNGTNRRVHRECEVFQDYFLYEKVYRLEEKKGKKYQFFEQDFRSWADCVRGLTFRNTTDWFRYFLQRGFAETYGAFPSEDVIEDSVDNLLLTLSACKKMGPYPEAAEEYEKQGDQSPSYKEYVEKLDYLKFYRMAVELSVVYLIAFYEAYFILREGKDFYKTQKERFLAVVSEADLSCPLETDILKKAEEALRSKSLMARKVRDEAGKLLGKVKILSSRSILEAKDDAEAVRS